MAFTSFVLLTICVAVCSGYTFKREYASSESGRLLSYLKARGFYPREGADGDSDVDDRNLRAESHWILDELSGTHGNQDEKEAASPVKRGGDDDIDNQVPEDLVDWVCEELETLLLTSGQSSVVNCSNDFLMSNLSVADTAAVTGLILNLTTSALVELDEDEEECLKSLVSIGSLYYMTTEKLFLGIYLTFYSELARTILTSPIPAGEVYKMGGVAHALVYHFWWRLLGSFLSDMQLILGIPDDEWAHQISNNQLTDEKDGLYAYFPEMYLSVRKVLVRQVYYIHRVLNTYRDVLGMGYWNCTGIGEMFIDRVHQLDAELNDSLSTILYDQSNLKDILTDALGDVPYLSGDLPIVDLFQKALQTHGVEVLGTAATLFRPLRDLDSLDEVTTTSLEIVLNSTSDSIEFWNTIGCVIHRLHVSLGSSVMNNHFYNTSTTDLSLIVSGLFQQLEGFADVSLSKKMTDILTGLVELKRTDFSLMNPMLWPSGTNLMNVLATQNPLDYNQNEATVLVEMVLAKLFVDNLEAAQAGTVAEIASEAVYLPLSVLGLFTIIPPEDMNQVTALITMVTLPIFLKKNSDCDIPRITPFDIARILRRFTVKMESDRPDSAIFADVASAVGKTWDVSEVNMINLVKLNIPTLLEDLRLATVILETFDSNRETATVVGSILATELHSLFWLRNLFGVKADDAR